jgi:GNAT superfamily N-acetyltransferase
MTVIYRELSPDEANQAAASLKGVYAAVFSAAPYNEGPEMPDRFVTWVNDESRQPGFVMIVADNDSEPVGFAYGYTMRGWFGHSAEPAPAYLADVEKAAVMEWAVLPSMRHKGIGRELMRRLLAERSERWAALMVNPASEARMLYERMGWRQVGTTTPSRQWPSMDIMVIELAAKSSPTHAARAPGPWETLR